MNNIEYYKNKKWSIVIQCLQKYDIYKEGNFASDEIKLLICLLIKNQKQKLLERVLNEILENYRYDRDYEFDEYFKYDNDFILQLLLYYKNRIPYTKKDFKLLLIKEKESKCISILNFNIEKVKCYNFEERERTISPLHIACQTRNKPIIKLLLDYGMNIDFRNNIGNTTLLYLAEFYETDNTWVIKFLIDHGANINKVDKNNNSILHKACRIRRNIERVRYLAKNVANINKINNDGNTALMDIANYITDVEYVKCLIKNGADINIANNKGETALFIACKHQYKELAITLIKYGADINKADNEGTTPLLLSCYRKNLLFGASIVMYFVENGADLNKANNEGITPLHELCHYMNTERINYFIEHGGDMYKLDNNGISPLMIRRQKCQNENLNLI